MKLNSHHFMLSVKKYFNGTLEQTKILKIKSYIALGFSIFLLIASIILGFFALAGYKFNVDSNGQFLGQSGLTIIGLPSTTNGAFTTTAVDGQPYSKVLLNYSPLVDNATARIALSVLAVVILTSSIIAFVLWFFYFLAYVKNPKKKMGKYDKEQQINAAKNGK